MTVAYWQAKIWGILNHPAFVPIKEELSKNNILLDLGLGSQSEDELRVEIDTAVAITDASDHGALGNIDAGAFSTLTISHLLSGSKLNLNIAKSSRSNFYEDSNYFGDRASEIVQDLKSSLQSDEFEVVQLKQLFWWLWRCLPEATVRVFDNNQQELLIPADLKFPDSSLWSNSSLVAAIAGSLVGYTEKTESNKKSRPYLANFTFSPIQELIKASRKMRDLWAGSWILHYLSAQVAWRLAEKYGPDCLLYPNLYGQPLIDNVLLQKYPTFEKWIKSPTERALLTAGFPNVIVVILPEDKVNAAMQTAKSTLLEAWKELGQEVMTELQEKRHWMPGLTQESRTWESWLESQWQIYWSAVPVGNTRQELKIDYLDENWIEGQNQSYGLVDNKKLLLKPEQDFFQSVNVGSWWANIFDQARLSLSTVKNARDWRLPTAFGPRSTVSGLGPVVHPDGGQRGDWITEGQTQKYWSNHAGLFDGIEQLNATETLKRTIHRILPGLLNLPEEKISAAYPDLTVGVAGYLKSCSKVEKEYYSKACQQVNLAIRNQYEKIPDSIRQAWGIPYVDEFHPELKSYHPRLLNSGWLEEELKITNDTQDDQLAINLEQIISNYYPKNNPTDWYVLAAGDGDDMSGWLKGTKMESYSEYIAQGLAQKAGEKLAKFLELAKRMGPSTHNALSRALLDFSNQLVPYITEERYAGRLIYGGGDDVLAYSNLWEWDSWLWDIRQCFRGAEDPQGEFEAGGDYWKFKHDLKGKNLEKRPLFTMGKKATISFGIVIAHHSVPLAIALENLWNTEKEAKEHLSNEQKESHEKDALQVRVLYGNGNSLKSTAKFAVFDQWRKLFNVNSSIENSIFEQLALGIKEHSIPSKEAITPWVNAFCSRREQLKDKDFNLEFNSKLTEFIQELWNKTATENIDLELQNWFKLAAFVLRSRKILQENFNNVLV